MGEQAIASGLIQVVIEQLSSTALEEFRLVRGVRDELEKLSSTLSTIQAVAEDAEDKQLRDKSVRDWIRKLKIVAYDVDDILDKYAAEALRLKVEGRARVRWKKVRYSLLTCYCSEQVLLRFRIAHNIKAVRERLDNVVKERDSLHLREPGGTSTQFEIMERPDYSSLVDDFFLFGREDDKEYIIGRLISHKEPNGGNVSIVPIVGMGGLGKTALAQLVYNDMRVESHFQLRMWVSVSETFDVSKITKEILQTFVGGNTDGNTSFANSMNLLQDHLKQKLGGKRFLLVLDDVWNENQEKWQRLRAPLIYGGEGSKILVTTRNDNVAKVMGASQTYGLKGLSDDDCWSLFQKYAFVDGNSDGNQELAEIGKKIVKKLKGLPLAAKALGSLLYSKLDENDWQYVLKSEVWELPPERNNILPALRLSYRHLPSHLKQCFAYCSVFHKDYEFERDNLIQIWMALGFIQSQGRKRAEDVGNNYFEDLLSRSFFQRKGENYVMHDMIHDLAQSVSMDEIFRIEHEKELNIPRKTRHLSVSYYNSKLNIFEDFHKLKSLRTLLLLRGYKSKICQVPNDLFLRLRCLRVLDLHRRHITELPSSIGKLRQLRYLGLTGTGIKLLPPTISRLYNLQTLKLQGCFSLIELPRGITQLINLRHLEAHSRLTTTIHGIGKLSCLQELEEFVVLNESGHKIRELKDMSGLHGKLCIQNLENVVDEEEAAGANMNIKEYLTMLELNWEEDRDMNLLDQGTDEGVLNGLQAHPNLKELKIKFFGGVKFPSWIGKTSMSNLHSICLSNCRKCEFLPPLGQLPFLKYLELEGMHGVRQLGREFYGEGATKGFPSLEELVVEDMPCLEEWSELEDDHLFPCLREFEIDDCPNLRAMPFLPPTLTRLRISGVGVSHLPGLSRCNLMTQSLSSSPPLSLSLSSSPSSSSSLSSLYISDCPNLTTLQEGLLGHPLRILEDLSIRDCQELVSLPEEGFEGLISLRSLHIKNCPKLASWTGERALPALLQKLQVRSCMDLVDPMLRGLRNLNSLQHLEIADCPTLKLFPDEVLPVTIEFLDISDCTNLIALPAQVQNLSSLVSLIISSCPQMLFLSEGAFPLPTSVRELYIRDCPSLKERCLKGRGKDWPKIAHIPNIEVDGEVIVSEIKRRRR